MGKRGPAPRGEYSGKSQVLSTRIRPDTRAALVAASKTSGRSLSQEIEQRLVRTFFDDEKIADSFGNRQTYVILRMVALAIQRSYNWDDWLRDPVLFDRVFDIIIAVISAIRPSGAPQQITVPLTAEVYRSTMPPTQSMVVWGALKASDPALPLNEGERLDHVLGLLKSELGEIPERPYPFFVEWAAEGRKRLSESAKSNTERKKKTPRRKGDETTGKNS